MSECDSGNDYDGRMGVRISAIFVIWVTSLFGTWFPVFAARHRGIGVPEWAFFIAKYFGSGVIIATAFIHVSHTPQSLKVRSVQEQSLICIAVARAGGRGTYG